LIRVLDIHASSGIYHAHKPHIYIYIYIYLFIQYIGWEVKSAVVERLRDCGSLPGREESFIYSRAFGEKQEFTSPPRE